MPLVINTNIQSLNAQRNLNKTLMPLQTAMQRLSSGLRINSAKDDAAGLAVAVRMNSQIKGLTQAYRNANDAVSLVQTAEGAIDEMTNALQRIRELAVQSANASNTALDRSATDKEVQQLIQEVDRIATQTQFNNQTLLDGTLGTKAFQIGANAGQTISVSLTQGLKSTQIGQIATDTGVAVSTTNIVDNSVYVNSTEVALSVAGSEAGQLADSAYAKAMAINSSGISGVTATTNATTNTNTNAFGVTLDDAADHYKLEINGVNVYEHTGAVTVTQSELVDTINVYASQTGVTAEVTGGFIKLTAADGRNIDIVSTEVASGGAANSYAYAAGTINGRGTLTLSSSTNIDINDAGNRLGFGAGTSTITVDTTQNLSAVQVTDVDKSNDAINRVDSALNVISNMRADLGAILNRFTSTMSNLSNVLENITAAHSRIMDADFASETANITKAQILQQAGISVLAQANSLPQNVLTLLRQ